MEKYALEIICFMNEKTFVETFQITANNNNNNNINSRKNFESIRRREMSEI